MEGSSEAGGQFNQQTHRGHHHGTGTWHWHILRVTALLPRYGIPTRFGKASWSQTRSSETVHHLVHGGITRLEFLELVEIRLLIQSPHTTKSTYCLPSTVFLGPLATLARTCEHHSELSPGHRWARSPVPSLHELPYQFALFVQIPEMPTFCLNFPPVRCRLNVLHRILPLFFSSVWLSATLMSPSVTLLSSVPQGHVPRGLRRHIVVNALEEVPSRVRHIPLGEPGVVIIIISFYWESMVELARM